MKWSYKTVHFELKKEGLLGSGFLDESEIEQELNEFGSTGWELVSVLEVQDGVIAFFKQPLTLNTLTRDWREDTPEEAVEVERRIPETEQKLQQQEEQTVEEEPSEDDAYESNSAIGAIRIE